MIGTVVKSFKAAVSSVMPVGFTVEKVRKNELEAYEPMREAILVTFDGADYPDIYDEAEETITNYPKLVNFTVTVITKDSTKEGYGAIDVLDKLLTQLENYDFSANFNGKIRINSIQSDELYGDFTKITANLSIKLSGY